MTDVLFVVTHTRSGGEVREAEEFGSREAAIGFLKGLAETYNRMEGYRAWLTRERGSLVMHAESTVPAPGKPGKTVTQMSRYEITERVV